MSNPAADYPTAIHTATDTSVDSNLALGATVPKHTDVHGKVEQEIVAIETKIGTGSSPASSATTGQAIIKQADGTTKWATPAGGSGSGDMTKAVYDAAAVNEQLVGLTASQTLSNKTLTSPVVNSPTGIVKGDIGLSNVDNTSDATKNSASVTLTNKTLTTPVINGISTGTGVASSSTANTLGLRDANSVLYSSAAQQSYVTTATAGGTTVLSAASSSFYRYFTGTQNQTVTLPVVSTFTTGYSWYFVNLSTGQITIQSSGGNTVVVLASNTAALVTCILTSGTTAASWNSVYYSALVASGKSLSANNTITFAGTDGTTMTFPNTSATIARTDAANTFTGVQTMTSPVVNTGVSGSAIDTDSTMAANSDTILSTQKAVKTALATKPTAVLDIDGSLAANSDANVTSQKAAKTYADTKIPNTTVSAKGSLITATAASTPVELAVGTNGQTAIADSTQSTGLRYVSPGGDTSGTFDALTVPVLTPKRLGTLGAISHSWAAGSALSSTGTPQFEEQGNIGRLMGMMSITNENLEHMGIAGSYLSRNYSALGTLFAGWAGVYTYVYPSSAVNINDVATSIRSTPAVAESRAWAIVHGINDAAIYGLNTTATNFTQTTLAWSNALTAVISRLRAGALYSSSLNTSAAIVWDGTIAFGGSGSWSDNAAVGTNTGPAYKSNATNGGTVTITIPANFSGGTVAVSYLGQVSAWSKLITSNLNNTDVTSTLNNNATFVPDWPNAGNFVIQMSGSSEQMLVTAGQGTGAWTVTRGFNSTSKTTHTIGDEIFMVSAGQINFTGTASGASGSLNIASQGLGGAGLGRSNIALVKRFTMTAADAGQTIICSTASIITSDTYTQAQFDSWWIEASDPPPIAVMRLPQISYTIPYSGLSPTQWTTFNAATDTVVGLFDGAVKVADANTPFYNRSATLHANINSAVTSFDVDANNVTTFVATWKQGLNVTVDGEDMQLTASPSVVSGSRYTVTVATRGTINGTSAAAHNIGRYISDQSWMHTDNIHPNAYGHGVIAKAMFDAFASMTTLNTYQIAMANGNVTQDNRTPLLGIRDNTYMEFNNNIAMTVTTTFTKNKQWYWPFYVPQKCLMVGAAIVTGTTTAGTATAVRMGLYDVTSDRYFPGALIKEFGTGATTALTTVVEVACHQVIYPGWYFLGFVNQGTTAGTVHTVTNLGFTNHMPYHLVSAVPTGGSAATPFFSDTGSITGALASAAPQMDVGPCPVVWIHLRAKHYV